jgi:hypothetical protein
MRGRRGGIIGTFQELRKGFWWIGEVASYRSWPPGRATASVAGAALKSHSPRQLLIPMLKTDGGTVA